MCLKMSNKFFNSKNEFFFILMFLKNNFFNNNFLFIKNKNSKSFNFADFYKSTFNIFF